MSFWWIDEVEAPHASLAPDPSGDLGLTGLALAGQWHAAPGVGGDTPADPAPAASGLARSNLSAGSALASTLAAPAAVVGDLDGDGLTSVADFGLLSDYLVSGGGYQAALDVNHDGHLDAQDLEAIRANFGAGPETIDPARRILVASLGDRDGDGMADLAVLQDAAQPFLYLSEVGTASALRTIKLNANYTYFDIEPILDGGVPQALAIAGINDVTGAARVFVLDLATHALTAGANFGRNVAFTEMEAWLGGDGHIHVAMTGEAVGRDEARLVVADLATGALISKRIALDFDLVGLEFGYDAGHAELVVAGQTSTGGVRLFGYDAGSLLRTLSFSFGKVHAVDLAMSEDPAGGGALFGLLSQGAGGFYSVDLRDGAGHRVSQVAVETAGLALELALWREDAASALHFSALEVAPASGFAVVTSGAFDGSPLYYATAGSGAFTDSLAMLHTEDGMGFALGQRNPVTGAEQVRMRLAEDNYRLPTFAVPGAPLDDSWFEDNRVHGHTRYFVWDPTRGTEFYDLPGQDNAAATFAALGAHVFTRSVRHYDDTPAWSSEYPVDEDGNQILAGPRDSYGHELGPLENLIQPMVNESWAAGVPMIAYFNDMSDAMLADMHPEWIVREHDGTPIEHQNRGVFLDITGPFGEVVQQRLLELADMGVAAILLDYTHLPLDGAWGSQIEADWIALTGTAAPPIGQTAEYQSFMRFGAHRMIEAIAGWEAALKAEYPGVELIVSVTTVPGLTRPDMYSELAAIGNPKSEMFSALSRQIVDQVFERNPDLHQPDDVIRQAFGFALVRDSAENGTPHFWKARSPTAEQDEAYIAAITTFGGIAALDIIEYLLEPGATVPGNPSLAEYAENFALGARISPFLADTTPQSEVGIYWSETARDAWYEDGDAATWANVNLPALGAFETLMDMGLTPTILTDSDVAHGIDPNLRMLFVPDIDNLSAAQLAELAQFTAAGGTVITGDATDWSTDAGYQAGMAAFAAAAAPFRAEALVRVDDLADGAMAQAYRSETNDNQLVVAITNSFDFVQAARLANPIPPDPVPAGASVFVDFDALPAGSTLPYAYDAVSGAMLEVTEVGGGWMVSLPGFAQMMLVVIEAPATAI